MFYKICIFFVFITILFLFKNYFHKKEESNFYKQKEINGFVVNYYTNDNMIGKTIENGNLWGYENINQYKKYYRPNTDILDVGGFIGTNSLVLSKVIDEGNHIHVFEPQYYDCLIKNIKDNKLNHVIKPYNCGLSNIVGHIPSNNIDLNEKGNYGGKHLTTLHDKQLETILVPKSKKTIELKRLDDFNFRNIGLIKIDVEGFELLVLEGGIKTIKNNNYPPIFIEIWEADDWKGKPDTKKYYIKNKNDIKKFLFELDYKIIHSYGYDYIFIHQ